MFSEPWGTRNAREETVENHCPPTSPDELKNKIKLTTKILKHKRKKKKKKKRGKRFMLGFSIRTAQRGKEEAIADAEGKAALQEEEIICILPLLSGFFPSM